MNKRYIYSAAEIDSTERIIIKSRAITAPPAHVAGEKYIVPAGATGEWNAHISEIAGSDGTNWIYASVPDAIHVYIEDEPVELICASGQFYTAWSPT